ncbi:MAG: hypothetical protein GXO10_05485 [Crenarchaeota archaeon]|nr:hypothetical protein [Thermoproteota archaeon]
MEFSFIVVPLTSRSISREEEQLIEELRKNIGEDKILEPTSKISQISIETQPDLMFLIFLSGGVSRTAVQIDLVYKCPKVIISYPGDNSLPSALGFIERKRTDTRTLHMYYTSLDKSLIDDIKLVSRSCEAAFKTMRSRIGIVFENNIRDEWYLTLKNSNITIKIIESINISKSSYEKFIEDLYNELKNIVEKYKLDGVTLDCFKLIREVNYTPCLAFTRLLEEGIPIACECDILSLLSMILIKNINRELIKRTAMMNLVDLEGSIIRLAHCTGPRTMFESYELVPHYETNLPQAIRGRVSEGKRCTIFRMSPDLKTATIITGRVVENVEKLKHLKTCQTRIGVDTGMYITMREILGNHHIVVLDNIVEELRIALWYIGAETVMIGSLTEQ